MNKYQEALENIIVYPLKEDCENSPCCQCKNQCDFYKMKLHDYDVLKELVDKETPKKPSLSKEECEKACLYLLSHCYEEDLNEDGTYTLTPSGFRESEIFKQLIEEHFQLIKKYDELEKQHMKLLLQWGKDDNKPLKFEDLKPNMWVWDNEFKNYMKIKILFEPTKLYPNGSFKAYHDLNEKNLNFIEFKENRFYWHEVQQ